MKIVLSTLPKEGSYKSWITPSSLEPKEVKYLPLGLLSLATNIQDLRHEVIILDPFSEGWSIAGTAKIINDLYPDVVGFSAATRWSYALYELLKKVRAEWKVVGGPHCTYHATELRVWGADAVFVGPLTDREFHDWLREPFRGIIQCETGINEIAFPQRNLMDYQRYFFTGKVLFEAKKRMSMFTSVGCPNACNFCSVQTKKVQYKYSSLVVEEMSYLKDACGAESLHVFDDNFNVSPVRLAGLLNQMDAANWSMEWSFRGQVKCDLSLVPRMKKLGLKRVHVGVESFEDGTLKWFRKNHRFEDIARFCKVMHENEVEVLGYFIIGTAFDTVKYIESFKERCTKLWIKPYVNILFPEPDTMYGDAKLSDFWDRYFKEPYPDAEVPGKDEKVMALAEELIK